MVDPRWTPREIPTSVGLARVHRAVRRGRASAPWLVLGHGAGGGIEAPDLRAVAGAAWVAGFGVVLVEQPWRVAGRRIAVRPAALDAAWSEVIPALRLPGPLVVGGRSAGARVACRTAARLGAIGVVALAFPLHPPGRPERGREDEATAVTVPLLVLQGSRDPFGTAAEVAAAVRTAAVRELPGADHRLLPLGHAAAEVVAFLREVGE